MNVTLPFSYLDKHLRGMNPIVGIVPVRIRADLTALTKTEKKNLRTFANIEDGISERILLVPDNITVGALEAAIDRSFGLIADMFDSKSVFSQADMDRIFPSLYSLIEYAGLILDDPFDSSLFDIYTEMQHSDALMMIQGPIYPSDSKRYGRLNSELKVYYKKGIDEGVMYNGRLTPFRDIPATDQNVEAYLDKDDDVFIVSLALDLHLFEFLAAKGSRIYDAEAFRRYIKKSEKGVDAVPKPLVHSFDSIRYNDRGEQAFIFHVDMPKDISSIIKDEFISVEDYIESVDYVSNTFYPDCIYKSGYDLFGQSASEYYEFIMSLHSGVPPFYHDLMKAAGWREPFLDLKRVLR